MWFLQQSLIFEVSKEGYILIYDQASKFVPCISLITY